MTNADLNMTSQHANGCSGFRGQDDDTESPYRINMLAERSSDPRGELWMREPCEVTDEEYADFYESLSNDNEGYLAVKHFGVEGPLEFRALLYVPQKVSNDTSDSGIRLYSQGGDMTIGCVEHMPSWLNSLKGVVDSADLPLNTSSECSQQNKILRALKKILVKQCLEMLTEIADREFYKQYGECLKLKAQVHPNLLRFNTSMSGDEQTSFKEYVDRMKDGQSEIYYVTGESLGYGPSLKLLEGLRNKGLEVLYLTDSIDEYCFQQLAEFDGKPIVSLRALDPVFVIDPWAGAGIQSTNTIADTCELKKSQCLNDHADAPGTSPLVWELSCRLAAMEKKLSQLLSDTNSCSKVSFAADATATATASLAAAAAAAAAASAVDVLEISADEAAISGSHCKGVLNRWFEDKGFGFLSVRNTNVFVHRSSLQGNISGVVGQTVVAKLIRDPTRQPGYFKTAEVRTQSGYAEWLELQAKEAAAAAAAAAATAAA